MKMVTVLLNGLFLLLISTTVIADNSAKVPGWGEWGHYPYALEPCINGGVSKTGLYPSQEIEIAAFELFTDKQARNLGNSSSKTNEASP